MGRHQHPLHLVHGDVYPGYIDLLLRQGQPPVGKELCVAKSNECVNIAGGVGHTKGPQGRWVGMQLYVMCPDNETAGIVIPAVATLVKKCDQEVVAQSIMDQLAKALRHDKEDLLEDQSIWKGAPLVRHL